MKLETGSTLVMIGDSITDVGRERPVGEGEGLGSGYVYFVGALIGATYPERKIRILNTGIGGDTVRELNARWRRDVIDLKPNWVSVMIGTNDVWRQFGGTDGVLPEEFYAAYTRLVQTTRPQLDGMVLMTPFYVEPDTREPMREMMDGYGKIVKRIASENDCIFVDTQSYFDKACESVHPFVLAEDRVHTSMYGSAVLARAFLKGIEFEL